MKTQRIYFRIIVFLIGLNICTVSFFLFSTDKHPHHPQRKQITEVIDFSAPIAKKVDVLEKAHFKQKDAMMQKNHRLHLELFKTFCSDPTNDEKKQAVIEDVLANQREIELLTFNYFRQIHELCTAAQQKQLEKMMREVFSHAGGPPPRH